MYPEEGKNHIFLYHAYALPFGGWVRDKNRQFTALPAIAPTVLPMTGGFASNSEKQINFAVHGKYQFGLDGPSSFHLYVGHAYSEVRGTVEDDENPYGAYTTTVRSVLDDVRINDDLYIEHSEAILKSVHDNPGKDAVVVDLEPAVWVGASNMEGVRVRGSKVKLDKHTDVDDPPVYTKFKESIHASVARGGPAGICNWNDPTEFEKGPKYAEDHAKINKNAEHHLRYSIFKDIDIPATHGVSKSKTSLEVDNFGRIFFGEVVASKGLKHLTMFRINLGCDNCGDAGGSGGTTNGGTIPP